MSRAISIRWSSASRSNGGLTRLRLGIADVDRDVPKGSPIDLRAAANTTSLYTGVETFPMLPEELSTDLTSLLEAAERPVVVVDLVIDDAGDLKEATAYRALIANHAKLTYEAVGMWLAGGATPEEFRANAGLEPQLRLQDDLAQRLRARRQEHGALDLETIEAQPVTSATGQVVDIAVIAEEPRARPDRGLHDRGERRDREVPRGVAASRRSGESFTYRSDGRVSSSSRSVMARRCLTNRARRRSPSSCSVAARRTLTRLPICRCPS